MQQLANCPACDTRSTMKVTRRFRSQQNGCFLDTQLVECDCGHVFTNPQPSWEELAAFYGRDYHVFAAPPALDSAAIERFILVNLRGGRLNHAKILPGGRYLDIGCGLGSMVASMSRLGMKAAGIEPSPIAAQIGREAGLEIFCGTLEQAKYENESFDSISMYHVLEHVHDPVGMLRECYRILKPNGEVLIGVPNYNSLVLSLVGSTWSALDQPRHLHHFRLSSLKQVSGRASLRTAWTETESLVEHVENELGRWLRMRMFIPMRLTMTTRIVRPLALGLTAIGNRSRRGEAIVAGMAKIGT